ncbi:hypothetical protein DL770_006374 [Monosporascus sp. CRB-9-2]|nr:hypothetical protein DL770_006374 [Monosporascus sp. CRB-9-2]
MKFTTSLISLLLAASSAQAIPGSSVEARQERRVVHAEFYQGDCGSSRFLGEQDFVQNEGGACIDVNIPETISCTLITSNNATRSLFFFNTERCNIEGSNHFQRLPFTTGGFFLPVEAAQFR